MHEGQILLDQYWIDRGADRDLFNRTRRDLPIYRKFYTEQLGWRIIQNEHIIKLEKIPAVAESFMGITEFTEISDYCLLCALLVFLDDKEDNEQFLLSELVDALEAQLNRVMKIDWTLFSQRKSLIRVLQYAEGKRFLISYEGNSENISGGMDLEILYENTGLSRYFATNFGYDTKKFSGYRDFEEYVPEDLQSDRGRFRTNRVYRQLVTAPAFYWQSNDDQDAQYIKKQRQWINKNLQEQLGGQLHVHRGSAYFVLDENDLFGEVHPRNAMLPQIVLLFCGMLADMTADGKLHRREDDTICMQKAEFARLVRCCKEQYDVGWSKEYREMSEDKLTASVTEYMGNWLMLRISGDDIIIYPGAGKLRGEYITDLQTNTENVKEKKEKKEKKKKNEPQLGSLF